MARNLSELLTGWENDVDVSTFSQAAQNAYALYRKYNRMAAEARADFEAEVQAQMPAGTHAVFNYRFGKLAMSVGDGAKADRQVQAKKPGTSLSAFLNAAKEAGRNA